ncbi:MAG: MBL fold metallo-hydrolase, partial [Clostridia bacterium]|nr:MBL fold metallo-hydrolase [Clostridia bacterium]
CALFAFLDVGQGDSTLIMSDSGYMLIDAGPDSSEERLRTKLDMLGIGRIDLCFFTHTDEDHIGGGDMLLRNFDVGSVYLPDTGRDSRSFLDMESAAEEAGVPVLPCSAGDRFMLGSVSVRVLAPKYPFPDDVNDASLIMIISVGETNAIFSGDAGSAVEKEILSAFRVDGDGESDGGYSLLPRCGLLKAGHHGSSTSTCAEWIETFRPDYAVISCGRGNSFGHPHAEVLVRLKAAGAELFRTDLTGDIYFFCDGQSFIPETGDE